MDGEKSDGISSNPALSDDLLEDVEKMKGDAIGNTLYSERWVIKTLLTLAQIEDQELSSDFESELCLLWDMTIEKDVVNFLMKHDFLTIATKVIQSTGNIRLLEIMVGIVGNMCCIEQVREELSHRETTLNTLLALFDVPDSCTLLQLVRLFHSTAWDLVHNPDFGPHWLENELGNARLSSHLSFILMSSTSEELIFSVLEFLNTICSFNINDKDFSQFFSTPELVNGLIECWNQLLGKWSPEDDFPSKYHLKAATHWTLILRSFTGQSVGRASICQYGEKLGDILSKIIMRSVDCADIIMTSSVILMEALVKVYFNQNSLKRLLHILHNLYQNPSEASTGESDADPFLQESIESYCSSVNSDVSSEILQSCLTDCNENHVLLFWKIINDRQVELNVVERAS